MKKTLLICIWIHTTHTIYYTAETCTEVVWNIEMHSIDNRVTILVRKCIPWLNFGTVHTLKALKDKYLFLYAVSKSSVAFIKLKYKIHLNGYQVLNLWEQLFYFIISDFVDECFLSNIIAIPLLSLHFRRKVFEGIIEKPYKIAYYYDVF